MGNLSSSFDEEPARPESRSLLEDDDEDKDDTLETEPFDNSEGFRENQSDPKISLKAANDLIIVVEDEVERDLPQKRSSSENQMDNMRRQLEITENLLKAKRAELEQLEIKRKEEVNFFEKKLQMKDCEMALEKKKEEERWKDQISKLRSELEKAKKEKDEETK